MEIVLKPTRLNEPRDDNFVPVTISWNNIQVFTKNTKRFYEFNKKVVQKEIIKNVSGEVKAGQLLAIMGASGAGKTTLLNVLTAKNLSKVSVKGVVKLNGQLANPKMVSSVSSYVQQKDIFIGLLTVREHLLFHAALRLDQSLTSDERSNKVEQLMTEFGLTNCADTLIGDNTFKGISGGEAKRLAFASEVLVNPSILFCDEPTSGLDSFMAENVVNNMKLMASQGRTVICTIHQPSSQVFQLFEQLLLMADGRVAYMGNREGALEFFNSLGMNCAKNFNPADFYINELAIIPGHAAESKQYVNAICDKYLERCESNHHGDLMTNSFGLSNNNDEIIIGYKSSIWRQFVYLYWRNSCASRRNPRTTKIRLFQTLLLSMIIGILYFGQKLNQVDILNMCSAMYLMLMNQSMSNLANVVQTFTMTTPLFSREYHNGMYRVSTYYIANVLNQIPFLMMYGVIFVCIYYFMVGLNPLPSVFFIHLSIGFLQINNGAAFGYLISCFSATIQMAMAISGSVVMPLAQFGGYFLNARSIPVWLAWIKYISWFHYTYEALMINQWQSISYIPCNETLPGNATQCLNNGLAVIDHYGLSANNLNQDILLLIVLIICYHSLAFISLYVRIVKLR